MKIEWMRGGTLDADRARKAQTFARQRKEMSVVIEVENVVRTFKTERVIDNASFVLSSCGVSALVAPNGSGKTTLMSIIAGLMEPTEGRVLFSDGEGTSDVALLLAGDKNLYMKNTVMEN